MSDFQMGQPEISEIPIEHAHHPSAEERFGDLSQAMNEAGIDASALFGAAEPNIPASIAEGDWGQNDRGHGQVLPPQPPVPGEVPTPAPRNRNVTPTNADGFPDPTTTSPYDDAAVRRPADPQPQQRQQADLSPEEYLQLTGNDNNANDFQQFGPQTPPQQLVENTQLGHLKNEVGELKAMLAQVLSGESNDPEAAFAAQVGLNEYDPDHVLTAAELRTILARTAGSLYNETRNMVTQSAPSQTQVDPRVEAVKAQMLQRYPWLGQLEGQAQDTAIAGLMGQGGQQPSAPSGTQSVQHHPGGQRPATFVERGSSINQQGVPTPRPRQTMADVIAAKRARGEYVSTEELGMALRERGVGIPNKH